MSTKSINKKKSRQYRNHCDEDYGTSKDEFKREVSKQRRNKSARIAYELGE